MRTAMVALLLAISAGFFAPIGSLSADGSIDVAKAPPPTPAGITFGEFYLEGRVNGFAIEDGGAAGSVTVAGVEVTVDGFPTVEAGGCVEVTGVAVFDGGHLINRVTSPGHFVSVACE